MASPADCSKGYELNMQKPTNTLYRTATACVMQKAHAAKRLSYRRPVTFSASKFFIL
jgi:hypothetical protein